jgi:hypothetical protein
VILETLIGALIGSAIGSAIGSSMRRPKKPGSVAAVCSCSHGFGIHEDGKVCHGQIQQIKADTEYGCDYVWMSCPCTVYDGLEPLPRVWAIDKKGELS